MDQTISVKKISALLDTREKEWKRRWTWNPNSHAPIGALEVIEEIRAEIKKLI